VNWVLRLESKHLQAWIYNLTTLIVLLCSHWILCTFLLLKAMFLLLMD